MPENSRDIPPSHSETGALERWGSFALAMSTQQPGLERFEQPGLGSLAWHPPLSAAGSALVLGDPFCDPAERGSLLRSWLQQQPRSAFFQVDTDTAQCLHSLGFHCTPMGYETWIPLAGWQLQGQNRKYLRNVLSRAKRQSISLQEWPDYRERMPELLEISSDWLRLRRRNARELSFLARPLDSCHNPATRCFVARRGGQTIAFVMFDPLYAAGRVNGYAASLLRARELGSAGWQDFIVLGALEHFRSRRLDWLTLGLSPFAEFPGQARPLGSPLTQMMFRAWSRYGNWLYNFRGVCFHKRFYPGELRTMWFCSRSPLPLLELRDALAAMQVSPVERLNCYLLERLSRLAL